jgi:hypothetical protein
MSTSIRRSLRERGIPDFDKWKAQHFGKHVKKLKRIEEKKLARTNP